MSRGTPNPYFERIIKSAHTFLSRWEGASAELWELTSHHKSLRILIRREDQPGNLVLSCLDPIKIKGPVRWTICDLRVTLTALAGSQEPGFCVADPSAGVEVLCGAIEVKENVKL
jgi:hypothetical protein